MNIKVEKIAEQRQGLDNRTNQLNNFVNLYLCELYSYAKIKNKFK